MKKGITFAFAAIALASCGGAFAQSTGPCPLGMSLTILEPSMVPSCVGQPMSSPSASSVSGLGGSSSSGGSSSGGQSTGSGSSAAGSSSSDANASAAAQAALAAQSQQWGGATNFGSVNGYGGVTQKIISCDDYSAMVGGLTNPRNSQLSYDTLSELGLQGKGEVENGWWAAKLTYAVQPSGVIRTGFGGAVVQYMTLDASSGGNLQQKAQVVTKGDCTRRVEAPCLFTGYRDGEYYSCGADGTGGGRRGGGPIAVDER